MLHTGTRANPIHQSDLGLDPVDYRPGGRDNAVWAKTVMGSAVHLCLECEAKDNPIAFDDAWRESVAYEVSCGRELMFAKDYPEERLIVLGGIIVDRFVRPWTLDGRGIIAAESSFRVEIDGIWYCGTLDIALTAGPRRVVFGDYKTGQEPPSCLSPQHCLYGLAAIDGEWAMDVPRLPGQHQLDFSGVTKWFSMKVGRSMPAFEYYHLAPLLGDQPDHGAVYITMPMPKPKEAAAYISLLTERYFSTITEG